MATTDLARIIRPYKRIDVKQYVPRTGRPDGLLELPVVRRLVQNPLPELQILREVLRDFLVAQT